MKKIFITGVMGFVGSNIAKKLIDEGYDVSGCDDLSFGTVQNLIDLGIYEKGKFAICDFVEMHEYRLLDMVNNDDVIIHCATSNIIYAQTHKLETLNNNYSKLFRIATKYVRTIYISTASVYGNPSIVPTPETAPIKLTNAYAESKWLGEQLFQDQTILRLSNVYGINQRASNPYCGVIGKFVEAWAKNKPIEIIGDGNQTRDFTYVSDVCDAVSEVIKQDVRGTYNIASGVETTLYSLAMNFARTNKVKHIDKRSIDTIDRRCLNISKAEREFGWKPKVSLEEGIELTKAWYKSTI